jgi:hypothetical protein
LVVSTADLWVVDLVVDLVAQLVVVMADL